MRSLLLGPLLLGLACATAAPVPSAEPPEAAYQSFQQAQERCRRTASECQDPTAIAVYRPLPHRPCQGIAVREPLEIPAREFACVCRCDADSACGEGQVCSERPGWGEAPAQRVCQPRKEALADPDPEPPCMVH